MAHRSFVAVPVLVMMLSAGLLGCGGGGAGPIVAAPATVVAAQLSNIAGDPVQTFLVKPGASWKAFPTQAGFVDGLAAVDLSRVNGGQPVVAGSVLELRATGSYLFDIFGNVSSTATGLLVDSAGRRLSPGSGSTAGPAPATVDCQQAASTDTVPEDFLLPGGVLTTLVVPNGAVALHLSVDDCFYNDNRALALDPIRVTITLRP